MHVVPCMHVGKHLGYLSQKHTFPLHQLRMTASLSLMILLLNMFLLWLCTLSAISCLPIFLSLLYHYFVLSGTLNILMPSLFYYKKCLLFLSAIELLSFVSFSFSNASFPLLPNFLIPSFILNCFIKMWDCGFVISDCLPICIMVYLEFVLVGLGLRLYLMCTVIASEFLSLPVSGPSFICLCLFL